MGLLSKILSFLTTHSDSDQNSSDASNAPAENPQTQRFPRVRVGEVHDLQVEVTDPPIDTSIELANISAGGMGVITLPGQSWPKPGAQFKGRIALGGTYFSFAARVVHRTESFLGAEFVLCAPELKTALNEYFSIELQSIELTAVNPKILRHEQDGKVLWLRGKRGPRSYHVYILHCKLPASENSEEILDDILEFQLGFLGFFVSWKKDQALQFSEVTKTVGPSALSFDDGSDTENLLPLVPVPAAVFELSQRFVRALNQVPDELKWKLLLLLESK